MKRNLLALLGTAFLIWSCGDNNTASSTPNGADSANGTNMNNNDSMNTMGNAGTNANTNANMNTTPLSKDDSAFAMEAAMGGMMEVEAGRIAQSNATHDSVKAFGAMMVNDHTKANQDLMTAVAGRVTIPTALPADKQKHLDEMRKMTGKAFDQHYIKMMSEDHSKDINKFEKEANSGTDPMLKQFAQNSLPVLRMHKERVEAIKKMKM